MYSSLFIRPYPAPHATIVPKTFTAGINGYFLVCLVPIWTTTFFLAGLYYNVHPPVWAVVGLLISILGLLFALAYLRSLKLEITAEGISYRNLFRGTRFVAYAEMSTVVLVNILRIYLRYAGDAPPRISLIITPNFSTGKQPVRIPMNFFPSGAENELFRILNPSVWPSGD